MSAAGLPRNYGFMKKAPRQTQRKKDPAVAALKQGRGNPPEPAPRVRGMLAPNATVFISSACIMVLELLAGRLISRYLGQSLYTWTNVIGATLAGIAIGNYIGGRIADRACGRRVLGGVFILAAISCLSILPSNVFLGGLGFLQALAWPWRIAAHVFTVFLPPFICLGMLSPVISKRALNCGAATGRTMGNLFAFSIGGSIAGTFTTGFVLLAYLGSRSVLLGTTGLLAGTGLLYLLPRAREEGHAGPSAPAEHVPAASGKCARPGLVATMFFLGVATMALELAAARILSRHFGQSIYTWTTIIGVILAGLSFGGYAGGRWADRIPAVTLLPALLVLAALFAFLSPLVNAFFAFRPVFWDLSWPVQILAHTLLAFLPAAFLMGACAPVIARLALGSESGAGRTVGVLYSWNALGSIAGTFSAGYALVALIGAAGVVYLAAVCLTILALAHARNSWWVRAWTGIALFLAVCALAPVPVLRPVAYALAARDFPRPGMLYEDESQYSYIAVYAEDPEQPQVRTFRLDKLIHSRIDLGAPADLRYEYEWVYSAALEKQRAAPTPVRALALGGGGYVFPRFLELTRPGSVIDVVEIDPAVTRAAHEAFGLPRDTTIGIYDMDARNFVEDLARRQRAGEAVPAYDCIFGDSLNDFSVPYHLTTREFTEMIRGLLAPGGVYMLNLIDMLESGRFLGAMLNTCGAVFPHVAAFATTDQPDQRATFVIAASGPPLDLGGVVEAVNAQYHGRCMLLSEAVMAELRRKAGVTLTDDYAPVENLLAHVASRAQDSLFVRRLLRADEFLVAGRIDDAIREAQSLLERAPRMAEAYIVLGRAQSARGDHAAAVAALRQAVALAPGDDGAQSALGRALFAAGRGAEAAACWRAALRINPRNVQAHASLGAFLVQSGRAREALPCLQEAVAIDASFVAAWVNLASAFYALEQYAGAQEALRKAIALQPDDPSLYEQLAAVCLKRNDFDGAWAAVRACRERGRMPDAAFLDALCDASGRREQAL